MQRSLPIMAGRSQPYREPLWLRVLVKSWWYLPLIHWAVPRLVPLPRAIFRQRLPPAVRHCGLALTCAGSALTLWSLWTLIRHGNGTPNPSDPPRIFVQRGPYRFCRNPMEQGNLLQLLGRAIALGCPRLALTSALFAVITHWWVVRREEQMLVQQFGDVYIAYCRTVPRWGWREPKHA